MWLAGFAGLLAWRFYQRDHPAATSSERFAAVSCAVLLPPYSRASATACFAATCNFGGPPSSRARSLRLLSGPLPPTVRYKKPRIGDAACHALENFARVRLNFLTHYFPERSLSAAHSLAVRPSVASEKLVPANRAGKRWPEYPRAGIFLFALEPLDRHTHPPGSIHASQSRRRICSRSSAFSACAENPLARRYPGAASARPAAATPAAAPAHAPESHAVFHRLKSRPSIDPLSGLLPPVVGRSSRSSRHRCFRTVATCRAGAVPAAQIPTPSPGTIVDSPAAPSRFSETEPAVPSSASPHRSAKFSRTAAAALPRSISKPSISRSRSVPAPQQSRPASPESSSLPG